MAVAILSYHFRDAKCFAVPVFNSLLHSTPPSKISLSSASPDEVLSLPSQSSVSHSDYSPVIRFVVHDSIICSIA
jgi:hypothetical protein